MGRATSIVLNVLVVLVPILAGFYQIYMKPVLSTFGYYPYRQIEATRNKNCKAIPELQACEINPSGCTSEEIVLHQPTGVIYLACSTQASRAHWIPAMDQLNATGASREDYVATYDPATSRITRLSTSNFNNGRGLSLHGMDVVPSASNPNELFVYLVNHRTPLGEAPAHSVGADSVIEIFTTTVGGATLKHVKTVQDPIIITPNDVVGSADGKSFYFTNDHSTRVGIVRYLAYLGHKGASVAYCHLDQGCKYALSNTRATNGIARAPNGTIYIADTLFGDITMLEPQTDNTLVVADSVKTGIVIDNLAVDADGQVWAAAIPHALSSVRHMLDPSLLSPSSAYRISINTGVNAFYGEKYKVEKVFEDDGTLMSGISSAVYDTERKLLFMHGIASPQLVVCNI